MSTPPATILVDIDDTLVGTKPTPQPDGGHRLHPLATLVASRHRITPVTATEWIVKLECATGDMTHSHWPFGILPQLNLADEEVWESLARDAQERYFVYPDAVEFLQRLRRLPAVRVFPATTNPRLIILAKLATAGLADRHGSPHFDDCFGGEEVSPGGKCGPQFFIALLNRTRSDPATTLVIGDNPRDDLAYARAAGLHRVVLVRREQTEAVREAPDGGLSVRSLASVPELFATPLAPAERA